MSARKQTGKGASNRPASNWRSPDYALIVDCMTVLAATAMENPTLSGDPDGNFHHAVEAMKPLQAAKDRALPRVFDTRARTVDGLIAKANLAPYLTTDHMETFRGEGLACAYAASLARDVGRLAKPSPAMPLAAEGGAK